MTHLKVTNIKLMCFDFSLKLLSTTFLILKRNERDIIKNVYIGLHVQHPTFLYDFNVT